jgi:hypothetical protein
MPRYLKNGIIVEQELRALNVSARRTPYISRSVLMPCQRHFGSFLFVLHQVNGQKVLILFETITVFDAPGCNRGQKCIDSRLNTHIRP